MTNICECGCHRESPCGLVCKQCSSYSSSYQVPTVTKDSLITEVKRLRNVNDQLLESLKKEIRDHIPSPLKVV